MSLFGSLFDENDNDGDDDDESESENRATCVSLSVASTVQHDEKPGLTEPAKPPAARPEHGLCGIQNRGATCYLNSLLQVQVCEICLCKTTFIIFCFNSEHLSLQ